MGVVDGSSLGGTAVHTTAAKHATEATTEAAATAAKELSKQILGSHATTAASATLEAGLTVLVINMALLRVGKDFVCVRDLLELFLCGGVVGVLVWRELERVQCC